MQERPTLQVNLTANVSFWRVEGPNWLLMVTLVVVTAGTASTSLKPCGDSGIRSIRPVGAVCRSHPSTDLKSIEQRQYRGRHAAIINALDAGRPLA
jgi:hypothetical protein